MNNKTGFNRLGLKTSHRRALKRNMVMSLFKYEQITTTKAKAKEVRRMAEKLITRAKNDSVHNRRQAARLIHDKVILNKLFSDLSKRYELRAGGYTRIVKMGYRQGDAADLVVLELVDKIRGGSGAVAIPDKTAVKSKKLEDGEVSTKSAVATKKTETSKSTTKPSGKTSSDLKEPPTAAAKKIQRGGGARGK